MGSDIEVIEEVPSPRPSSSQQQHFEATRCRNKLCAKRRQLDGDELEECHSTIKELKASIADLTRIKEKYKKKFKEMEDVNKLLQQDFDAYQEQMEQVQTIASHEVDATMLRRNASAADYFYDEEEENSRSYQEPAASSFNQTKSNRQRMRMPSSVHKILETTFEHTPVLTNQQRKKLCQLTNLSEAQVIDWFMERSSKENEMTQGTKRGKTIKEFFELQAKKRREDTGLRKQQSKKNESSLRQRKVTISSSASPDLVDITFSPPKLTPQQGFASQDTWNTRSQSFYSQQNSFVDYDPQEKSASDSSIDVLGISPTTPVLAPKKISISRSNKKLLSSTPKTTYPQNRKSY